MMADVSSDKAQNVVNRTRREHAPVIDLIDSSMLLPGERVVHIATISPGVYWKGIVLFFISLAVMVLAFPLGAFLLLVSLIMLALAFTAQRYLLLAATDKRVIIRHGILFLDVIQLRYSKIESVELAWTLIGEMLGYASVVITGTGNRMTIVPFVADAVEFRRSINEILLTRDDKILENEEL